MWFVDEVPSQSESWQTVGAFTNRADAETFAKTRGEWTPTEIGGHYETAFEAAAPAVAARRVGVVFEAELDFMKNRWARERFGLLADLIAANGLAPWPACVWFLVCAGEAFVFNLEKDARAAQELLSVESGPSVFPVAIGVPRGNGLPGFRAKRLHVVFPGSAQLEFADGGDASSQQQTLELPGIAELDAEAQKIFARANAERTEASFVDQYFGGLAGGNDFGGGTD